MRSQFELSNFERKLYNAIQENQPKAVAAFTLKADHTYFASIVGQTPIQFAASEGYWNCVNSIANSEKTDAADKAKYGNALLAAIKANKKESVEILLKAGAPTIWVAKNGNGCLHLAIANRNMELVVLLLSYGVDLTKKNKAGETPIEFAANFGYWDYVNTIARSKKTDAADEDEYGAALFEAIKANKKESVEILLNAGAPTIRVAKNGNGCLHLAIANRNMELVVLLLSYDVSLTHKNKAGETAIQFAAHLGDWEYVNTIARSKKTDAADEAEYGAALFEAIKANKKESVEILLNAGAPTTWVDPKTGNGCLHLAIANPNRNMELVALLASYGVGLTHKNKAGQTAIQFAAHLGDWEYVNTIARSKKTDAADEAEYGAALFKAINANKIDSVRILLDAGAPYTWSDKTGNGCLHMAIKNRNMELVALLLSYDVDLTQTNKAGETAIQFARNIGYTPAVSLFESLEHKLSDEDLDKIITEHLNEEFIMDLFVAKYPGNQALGRILLHAIQKNNLDRVQKLIQKQIPINNKAFDVLHAAVSTQNLKMVHTLLNAGANYGDSEKKTLLELALAQKNHYMAAFLIGDQEKREKLIQQASTYSEEFLNAFYYDFHNAPLLEDNHTSYSYYQGLVFEAVRANSFDLVRVLIKENPLHLNTADLRKVLTYQDGEGNTILHWAVSHNNLDMLVLLLTQIVGDEKGIFSKTVNHQGRTPEHLASDKEHLTILDFLQADYQHRKSLLSTLGYTEGGSTQSRVKQRDELLKQQEHINKKNARHALSGQATAMAMMANAQDKAKKYDSAMLFAFLAITYNSNMPPLERARHKEYITRGSGLLQKFVLDCLKDNTLNILRQKYSNLDPFTLVLLAMELEQRKYPIQAQEQMDSIIKAELANAMGIAGHNKPAIDEMMAIKKALVRRLISPPKYDEQKAEEKSDDIHWEEQPVQRTLREALTGNAAAIRQMANYYQNMKIPEYGRAMLFSCLTVACIGFLRGEEYVRYINEAQPDKSWTGYLKQEKSLLLLKEFLLEYSSPTPQGSYGSVQPDENTRSRLGDIKDQYQITDPITLILFALNQKMLENQNQPQPHPNEATVYTRLQESIKSILLDLGLPRYNIEEVLEKVLQEKNQAVGELMSQANKQQALDVQEETLSEEPSDAPPAYATPSAPPAPIPTLPLDTANSPMFFSTDSPEGSAQGKKKKGSAPKI